LLSKNITAKINVDMKRRVALVIRDGWGVAPDSASPLMDATKQAATPHTDSLRNNWPHTTIRTDGLAVGLPSGVMGNSEVGHQNIGAGRIVDQEIVRIDKAMQDGSLHNNAVLREAFAFTKKNNTKLHLIGLCSDGGVHSMTRHAIGLLQLAKSESIQNVCFHALMDGRDVPPGSGSMYVEKMENAFLKIGIGRISTVIGRFWAMDRDSRLDRVEKAYNCLIGESDRTAQSAQEAIKNYYKHPAAPTQIGDEFIPPTLIVDNKNKAIGTISDGDAVIFFNFRGDRPRELTHAFLDAEFQHFHRAKKLHVFYCTMTEYEKGLCSNVLFQKPKPMKKILGAHLSDLGLRQFRAAETEKYAHVTFFFNDYREEPFPLEDRILIQSPKDVATYDLKPAMSAHAVCTAMEQAIRSKKYDFLVVNFANPDMVGHTGNFDATKLAVHVVDECIGRLVTAAQEVATALLVTSDHGNAEEMWDTANDVPHTQHTTNPVELFLCCNDLKDATLLEEGKLADVAPTILSLIGVSQPKEMTGRSLIH
jgi:2,3-bisphosphoglycerate-independent phosphoglycerate mutase